MKTLADAFWYMPMLIFSLLLTKCGNTTTTSTPDARDSAMATQAWNNSIPGNFSTQKILKLDSNAIDSFFRRFPDLAGLDTNLAYFYAKRNFNYAWFDQKGLIEQSGNLLTRIANLRDEGIFKVVPYKKQLDSLLSEVNTEGQPATEQLLELMLSAQYFNFARWVWDGENKAVSESMKWYLPRKKVSYETYLDSLLSRSDGSPNLPIYRQYDLLKGFLAEYRKLAESNLFGPPIPSPQKAYKVLEESDSIKDIRKRLFLLGDYQGDTLSTVYSEDLWQAVKDFQSRSGLRADGVIGAETVHAMNITPDDRIKQILVNMERCRWLPLRPDGRYLAVNIPEFKLHVYDADSLLWSTNVVVGKDLHQTVTFAGDIKYVVFSPYWNVPPSITRNEIVPAMNRNSNYLARNHMEITGYNGNLPVIRQKPGRHNSLGLVKFLFPNSHNIYLHDSPAKSLFNEDQRAFSHGCVRVAEPARLAQFLLQDDPGWTSSEIEKAMQTGKEKYVTLEKTVPVFLTYFTAFVDRAGKINFRRDIYNRDGRLADMLISGN